MFKTARALATELYELRIQFLRGELNCLNAEQVIKIVHYTECIIQKSGELARAVLDETKQTPID